MLYLRYLDIDDLIILASLLQETALKNISGSLGLTPPALTHRLNKYRCYIPNFTLKTSRNKGCTHRLYPLDAATKDICLKAKHALDILSKTEDKEAA